MISKGKIETGEYTYMCLFKRSYVKNIGKDAFKLCLSLKAVKIRGL